MLFYYIFFLLILSIGFWGIKFFSTQTVLIFLVIALFFLAALRPDDVDRDYITYLQYINNIQNMTLIQIEPTFIFFTYLFKLISLPLLVFVLYAAIALFIKFDAIGKLTELPILTILVFFSYYFMMQEMTQIRAAVSSGLLLLAIPDIYDKRPLTFFLKIIVGSLFHYSLLIFLPFYFLNPQTINRFFYGCLIIVGYGLYIMKAGLVNILSYIQIDIISAKVDAYNSLLDKDVYSEINVFNYQMILKVIFFYFLFFKLDILNAANKYVIILVKIYAFSLFTFVALADLPVVAIRINQLLGIVEIILIPFLVYLISPRYVAVIAILLICLEMMSIELFYNHLLNDYLKII